MDGFTWKQIPAILTNRFVVHIDGQGVRITFGDQVAGDTVTYHCAAIMSVSDAEELGEVITNAVKSYKENIQQSPQGKPN